MVLEKVNYMRNLYKYRGAHQRMHGESSLQLITITGGTDESNNADLKYEI